MGSARHSAIGRTPRPRIAITPLKSRLAHTVGNEVERAYRRTDMFNKRRTLMDAMEQVRHHRAAIPDCRQCHRDSGGAVMSRQTPSAVRKRIGMALTVSDYIARALRGDDDEISRRIRASYSDVPREIGYDFNNPDDAERVKEVINRSFWRRNWSAPSCSAARHAVPTPSNAPAAAKAAARADYKEQRGEGYSVRRHGSGLH